MCNIGLSIPNEVLYDTRMNAEEANAFAKRAIALCYYTQEGVSLGYCAEIAEMSKEEFIKYLGDNHVSIFSFDSKEEFLEEINNA